MIGSSWANSQYFNPRHIGGLVLWLDGADPSANGVLPSNGTGLQTWVDKSTQGNDFSQATSALRPTFQTNIINSRPAILTNGSTQYMSCSTSNGFPTGGNGRAMFVVCRTGAITGTNNLQYFVSIGQYTADNA